MIIKGTINPEKILKIAFLPTVSTLLIILPNKNKQRKNLLHFPDKRINGDCSKERPSQEGPGCGAAALLRRDCTSQSSLCKVPLSQKLANGKTTCSLCKARAPGRHGQRSEMHGIWITPFQAK